MLPFRLTVGVLQDSKPAVRQIFPRPYLVLACLPVAGNFVQTREGNIIGRAKRPGLIGG